MSRLNGRQIRKAHEFCIQRDGPECQMAPEKSKHDRTPCKGGIVLDHIDNNPENNAPDGSNWQRLCRGHNSRKNHRGKSRVLRPNAFNGKHTLHTHTHKGRLERSQASVNRISGELKKSEEIRPVIEDWILETVEKEGKLEMQEAMDSGSFIGKCDQGTVKKYIKGLKSRVGPLTVSMDGDVEYLVFKKGLTLKKVKTNGQMKILEADHGR